MELTKLLNSVKTIQVTGEVQRQDVASICIDSRKVIKNSVFVAIKGYSTDGHKFIIDALNNGAIAIVLEDNNAVPEQLFNHYKAAKIHVVNSRIGLAEISTAFYNHPSNSLDVIGITGTNGKTTTSYFIRSIFNSAGVKNGLLGTIANFINNEKIESSMTTPEANEINYYLHRMIEENCKSAVMEVSSHSLELERVRGINFKVGVLTNITSDHLDFHNTFENYLNAKKKLFNSLSSDSFAIINSDDVNSDNLISGTSSKVFSYGQSVNSNFKMSNIEFDLTGTRFSILYDDQIFEIETKMIGEFNAYNAAAAFASTYSLGYDPKFIVDGIRNADYVPGRFEIIRGENKYVVVDYAHTGDSLEKALINLRKLAGEFKKIITVFGCGGNRDTTKRPIMGNIASQLSDYVFITDDNSRFEDPEIIIKDITKGITKNNFKVIPNREEAIKSAIEYYDSDSVILIAGKGHEEYQLIKGVKHHFSDKETAMRYLFK